MPLAFFPKAEALTYEAAARCTRASLQFLVRFD